MAVALRTARLLLGEWRDEDREPFAAMSVDPEVMRPLVPFPDRAAMDAWVAAARAHWCEHGFGPWFVEIPSDASFIGIVGLRHVAWPLPFTPAVEAAWRLARPYWGQGYPFEAARAALDDGFERLRLAEIVAFTVPANSRSRHVMERLGMRRDAADDFDFDHPQMPPGHPMRRHVLYRIRR